MEDLKFRMIFLTISKFFIGCPSYVTKKRKIFLFCLATIRVTRNEIDYKNGSPNPVPLVAILKLLDQLLIEEPGHGGELGRVPAPEHAKQGHVVLPALVHGLREQQQQLHYRGI